MPCAWGNRGYAECVAVPVEIGDEPVDLNHPAFNPAVSVAMLECMMTAVKALKPHVAPQTCRRMHNVDCKLFTAIGTLRAAMHNDTSDLTFQGDDTIETVELEQGSDE